MSFFISFQIIQAKKSESASQGLQVPENCHLSRGWLWNEPEKSPFNMKSSLRWWKKMLDSSAPSVKRLLTWSVIFKSMKEHILERSHLAVPNVTKSLHNQGTWRIMKQPTVLKNPLTAHNVTSHSKLQSIWLNTWKLPMLKKSHTAVTNVTRNLQHPAF